jgi:transportin-3
MAQNMESMPEMGTVYNLIRTLYFNEQNGESKEMASKWLESLQHSIYGWKIADELLINKSDIASCYFAAQTLRTKIQNCFQELPEDSYSSLKDSIINHLKSIPETVVQTQLCLAITYLGINC